MFRVAIIKANKTSILWGHSEYIILQRGGIKLLIAANFKKNYYNQDFKNGLTCIHTSTDCCLPKCLINPGDEFHFLKMVFA